jgi:uncharacterized membrane protein
VPERERRFKRGGDSFERLAFVTDGVFAIAMTLIVVGIGVPVLTESSSVSDLWHGLGDHLSEFISFFIGVLVLGFYWIAHQESYDRLGAIDRRYLMGTVLYLGGIAFLPYPIRLVGAYSDNPVAWTMFAANLAVVSGLETVLFVFAWRSGLLRDEMSPAEFRWQRLMSFLPVPLFLVSIPVAFVNTSAVLLVWALSPVVQTIAGRRRPAGVRA